MAKITDYPSITTIDANTILLADGSSGTGKILASDMAKYALETYAGSTLAGSAQSVKSALNAFTNVSWLKRSDTQISTSVTAYVDAHAPGVFAVWSTSSAASAVGAPATWSSVYYLCIKVDDNTATIIAIMMTRGYTNNESYIKQRYGTGGWAEQWEHYPTRSEVDALNSNLSVYHPVLSVRYKGNDSVYNDLHTSVGKTGTYYRAYASFDSIHPILGGADGYLDGFYNSEAYGWQRFHAINSSASLGASYIRQLWNGTWSAWTKEPTRAEMDEVNSNISETNITATVTLSSKVSVGATSWFSVRKIGKLVHIYGVLKTSEPLSNENIISNLPLASNSSGYMNYCAYDSVDMWASEQPSFSKMYISIGTGNLAMRGTIPSGARIFLDILYTCQ